MKMIALAAAGLVVASAMAPAPAQAQRYGYYDDRGWDRGHDRRWRDDRRWRGDRRGWRGDRRHWRGDRGWRGRSYVRCHWVRGWYGPQRQCYRVYR